MKINIINNLVINDEGVLVNKKDDAIHLRQGDVDGACGPYCVMMALLVIEKIGRSDIVSLNGIDYRTKVGKLFKEIHTLDPLVLSGSDVEDLQNILKFDRNVKAEPLTATGKSLFPRVRESLDKNSPVILDVHGKASDGFHHWVLAIGYSEEHLFLLDPSFSLEPSNYWNSVLSTKPQSTVYPYFYKNKISSYQVKINNILTISGWR